MMTHEQAKARACAEWGNTGWAHDARNADPRERYEVGRDFGGLPRVLGRGDSWEAAFANAGVTL